MLRMLSISICRCDANTNRRFVQESCCHYLWPCWGRCVVSKLSFRSNAWNTCIFLDNHTCQCVWLYTRFIFHACPRDMTTSFEAFKSFQAVEDPVQADSNYPITNRIFVDRQKKMAKNESHLQRSHDVWWWASIRWNMLFINDFSLHCTSSK